MVGKLTPLDLDLYLSMFRKHHVMSAKLIINGGEVCVTFEPNTPAPMPGDEPTPGGWKGPTTLDAPFEHEVP